MGRVDGIVKNNFGGRSWWNCEEEVWGELMEL